MNVTGDWELMHKGVVFHLKATRTGHGTHDIKLGDRLVATAQRIQRGKWLVTSEVTGSQHGGHAMQHAVCQLFYGEVEQW